MPAQRRVGHHQVRGQQHERHGDQQGALAQARRDGHRGQCRQEQQHGERRVGVQQREAEPRHGEHRERCEHGAQETGGGAARLGRGCRTLRVRGHRALPGVRRRPRGVAGAGQVRAPAQTRQQRTPQGDGGGEHPGDRGRAGGVRDRREMDPLVQRRGRDQHRRERRGARRPADAREHGTGQERDTEHPGHQRECEDRAVEHDRDLDPRHQGGEGMEARRIGGGVPGAVGDRADREARGVARLADPGQRREVVQRVPALEDRIGAPRLPGDRHDRDGHRARQPHRQQAQRAARCERAVQHRRREHCAEAPHPRGGGERRGRADREGQQRPAQGDHRRDQRAHPGDRRADGGGQGEREQRRGAQDPRGGVPGQVRRREDDHEGQQQGEEAGHPSRSARSR